MGLSLRLSVVMSLNSTNLWVLVVINQIPMSDNIAFQ